MSRELRRVPADWEHPKKNGRYQPMHDRSFRQAMADWDAGYMAWKTNPERDCEYHEWDGPPPDRDYYFPDWPTESRTHYQMYENTTEGTPISPVFATVEELCRWLADTGASAFADMTATYEEWLAMCGKGWAPSLVIKDGEMRSGVGYASTHQEAKE